MSPKIAPDSNIQPYRGAVPRFGQDVFVHRSACVIGDVSIGDRSSVWCGAVVRGDVHRIRIGAETSIQDLSVLHVSHCSEFRPEGAPLFVGDRVTVGHRVVLHGCTVGDECLIGMGAIVMDGAVLEPGVLLGAGSLVPEGMRLKSGYLYFGAPAREVRLLTQAEAERLRYSAAYYVGLQKSYQGA